MLLECKTTAITGVPLEALEGEGSSHLIDSANVKPASVMILLSERSNALQSSIRSVSGGGRRERYWNAQRQQVATAAFETNRAIKVWPLDTPYCNPSTILGDERCVSHRVCLLRLLFGERPRTRAKTETSHRGR